MTSAFFACGKKEQRSRYAACESGAAVIAAQKAFEQEGLNREEKKTFAELLPPSESEDDGDGDSVFFFTARSERKFRIWNTRTYFSV